MPKKVNIKKFLSSITENQILESLFKLNKIEGVPEIHDNMDKKDKAKIVYEFYKNLDPENRLEIEDTINLIGVLDNKHAQKIIKSKFKDTATLNTPLVTLSKSVTDLAIAFYIEHFEKVEEISTIAHFYLKSGYKRFESNNKLVSDIDTKNDMLTEDRKSTRLNSSHSDRSRMPSSAWWHFARELYSRPPISLHLCVALAD